MAIDIFVNNGSATVSAGGTTAPAAGTVETWTLSSIVGLAASSSAFLPTQMRLIDPAASSEIVLLTNLSGATATVARGAEGTMPVAHSAGFTVTAVASATPLMDKVRVNGGYLPDDMLYEIWTGDSGATSGRTNPQNGIQGALAFARKDATLTTLFCNVQQAGAGLTAAGLAIYLVNGDGSLTLLGNTADLSTAFQSTGQVSAALTASVSISRGAMYALVVGWTGTTAPQFLKMATATTTPGPRGDGTSELCPRSLRVTNTGLSGTTWPATITGPAVASGTFWLAAK